MSQRSEAVQPRNEKRRKKIIGSSLIRIEVEAMHRAGLGRKRRFRGDRGWREREHVEKPQTGMAGFPFSTGLGRKAECYY